jgi:uncharacterized membrane protein
MDESVKQHEWLLKRNCCLTPRQFVISYFILFALSWLMAFVCALNGLWQIAVFTAIEMVATAVAFLCYARHATDYEHIAIANGVLLVESIEAGKIRQIKLDPACTRIALPQCPGDLIQIEARGVKVEIGRHITQGKRRQVGSELKAKLRGQSLCMA